MRQTFYKHHSSKCVGAAMFLTLLMLFFLPYSSYAAEFPATQSPAEQTKGKIINGDGQAMAGVTVVVKETGIGTISDNDGYYLIKASEGQTLTFAFMGYETITRTVPASLNVDLVMNEDVQQLDEVVIVGMGTQRRASVIGSISTINVADLTTPSRSLTNALSGRMAGVIGVQRSGEPGYDNSEFWIRGISTFGANKTPLVLVDGVERDMTNLSSEEVESISILKDASATAVYGVRAANGVVLVTTRKGIAASRPVIDLKMEYGISSFTRMPKLLDGVDYMTLYNEAAGRDVYSAQTIQNTIDGTNPYLYPNVDWFDEIFKNSSNNGRVSVSVNGGGGVARYFVTVGMLAENGNLRDNTGFNYSSNIKLRRYNFRTNTDVSLTKTTTLGLELGGYLTDGHYPGTSTSELFNQAFMANPVKFPVNYPMGTNPDGSTKYVWAGTDSPSAQNPAERLMGSGFNDEFRNQFMGQASLNQDFGFWVEGLSANVALSFDAYNQTTTQRYKKDSYYLANGVNADGSLNLVQSFIGDEYLKYGQSLSSNRTVELKGQLNYNRVFGGNHRVGAMAMYYQRDYKKSTGDATESLPYRKQGLAIRATYSFKDRYFAEFNLGYNGSENFPSDQRFGVFPAGAIGYIISNEKFWQNSKLFDIIPLLKIKGSVGLVGAEALPGNRRYGYMTIVGGGLGNYRFGSDYTDYAGTGENQIGVANLTWEKGLKSNIGIEVQFLRNMISLSVDYFYEKRSDILINRTALPTIIGLVQNPYANIGIMRNQGVDGNIEINHNIGKFHYRIYGNATYTRNKIVDQDEPSWKYPYQNRTGKKYGQQFGLTALGYFRDQEEIDLSPEQQFGPVRPGDIKYLDVNGDGVIDSTDETAIGYSNVPELVYGFGAQFMYKGFDVGFFFRGQSRVSYMMGGEGFIPFKEGSDRGNLFKEALDRWTVDNPRQDAFYPRLSIGNSENNFQNSTKWLYSGNLLRLADVEIGYNFPQKWLKPMRMSGLRIYVLGSNLALFSPFKMWDPESGDQRGAAYPLQRKINFGIKIKF